MSHVAAFRRIANLVNLTTPLGLAIARLGGAKLTPGPHGLWLADGYRLGLPLAGAFTVGNVVIARGSLAEREAACPGTLAHEERHATQYAYCLGLPFFPAYLAAMGWSWVRTGDRAAACFFEREAGLVDGGYRALPVRPLRDVLRRGGRPRGEL